MNEILPILGIILAWIVVDLFLLSHSVIHSVYRKISSNKHYKNKDDGK